MWYWHSGDTKEIYSYRKIDYESNYPAGRAVMAYSSSSTGMHFFGGNAFVNASASVSVGMSFYDYCFLSFLILFGCFIYWFTNVK